MMDPDLVAREFLHTLPRSGGDEALKERLHRHVQRTGRLFYKVGARQLVIYRGFFEHLARRKGADPE